MSEETDLEAELATLPKGTIIRRTIRGTDRFYHQWREDGITKSRYLSPGEILPLRAQLERRKYLQGSVPTPRAHGIPRTTFRCDVLTGRFLTEYAASANYPQKRDCFSDLFNIIHSSTESVPTNAGSVPFIFGPRGVGKTTILQQLIHALPPTHRARAAYLRLTGDESSADVTGDLALLRDLGFRFVFFDEAHHLAGLAGTGLTLMLAGESVPAALGGRVAPYDLGFIPFREFARLTGETNPTSLIERGGTLGTDPGNGVWIEGCLGVGAKENGALNDRFVLDMLALAAIRAKDEAREHGEAFLGTDLQKLRNRFAEMSGLTGEEDDVAREALLAVPMHRRLAHAQARITDLLADPILDRLGAAERKIIRDLLTREMRYRLLEDAVWNELRHARMPTGQIVHRVPFAPGAYGFVIADEEELTCEIIVLTTDAVRDPAHVRYLDDPARLDVLEHRYGMITNREVLYNGRDARLASGVSYRNLARYLTRLG